MHKNNPIYIGELEAMFVEKEVKGELVRVGQEKFYKISNVNEMKPFFMSIVSNSNHWMFIASNGGLTAGRKNSNSALFPYYTDDKIIEGYDTTGSKTIIQLHLSDKTLLWEPFSDRYQGVYKISRNLYKNTYGNKIIFEEINHDAGLTYSYEWNSSDEFGFVKKASLKNNSHATVYCSLIDGVQNIIPHGVGEDLQATRSNLVHAYKKNELETDTGLGIYALSAIIVDKAEPSEALKATMVWSLGFNNPTYLLSSLQLENFRKGKEVTQEIDCKAEKGAYFIKAEVSLEPKKSKEWMFIADVDQSLVGINKIKNLIKNEPNVVEKIQETIDEGTKKLVELTGAADGLQLTADTLKDTRHFANTMFNIMRGGIFDYNYQIEKTDFEMYISKANKQVYKNKQQLISRLPELFSLNYIKEIAHQDADPNFSRLCMEYMPLKFSRRHGDPSRPWNRFSINTKSEDGSKVLDYQGNWRDIFQNWEALAHSYPEFIESMIFKFLNASTFDGYNPYRVTKDGFDWEIIEPHDPWSYIGYWGDHQLIYLLKFLEIIEHHYPNKLAYYFNRDLFVYANVPYKIKSYKEICANPKDTIVFDGTLDRYINKRKQEIGADAALISIREASIYQVNLIEKLLATVLAKVSNFVPEAGIWLNTQRPEWNDANNALVGNGVSMVTLYYLRRFLKFFQNTILKAEVNSVAVSKELTQFFGVVSTALKSNKHVLAGKISDKDRKTILDSLGLAGSEYRLHIYKSGFSNQKETITTIAIEEFINTTLQFIDHSIEANRRSDNLFHAYNLMTIEKEQSIAISYLPEMLEGQVAVLSSGYLTSSESLELLRSLKNSALYRKDQDSYILYPNKELPRFTAKNIIPAEDVESSEILKKLLADRNTTVVEKDCWGNVHFNGSFNNANSLQEALAALPQEPYGELLQQESNQLLAVFEKIFNHKSFTGRSGTFFGYEGLGSIYWHMVSKLSLAVQEICWDAINNKEEEALVANLIEQFYTVNEGIGVHKSPQLYGAFPTDPYSHTPAGKGAQQPGMTGQVKEDILSRFGELGVFVKEGKLQFNPRMVKNDAFLAAPQLFKYTDNDNQVKELEIPKDALCFMYCQLPIVYELGLHNKVEVAFKNGTSFVFEGHQIDTKSSKLVFQRNTLLEAIKVTINRS